MSERLQVLESRTEETENYIVFFGHDSGKWELRRKVAGRTLFLNSCEYKTPLIVKMNKLENGTFNA